ncbi:dephospho-CoA kinase [Pedobacter arcticus]|uniref:dephospho-CoA kinase n=1 Tax=Pedobacter arcticus TaxID=752140 RepID=UPI000312104F|nr:dephospho-CoA kinase [Pedobacter arcticus]
MLKVGITGGIGSGKTTVCEIFELLNIPVFNADDSAKTLMVTDKVLIAEIKSAFGAVSYFEDGSLNRKHIAELVFSNPEKLALLNSFVHPAVFKAMELWVLEQTTPYVLKEAALLFESGSYLSNDFNILVSAPEKLRIARVMKRDNVTAEKVKERIQNQMPEEEKKTKADFIIDNNETEFLINQVLALHHQFIEIASKQKK